MKSNKTVTFARLGVLRLLLVSGESEHYSRERQGVATLGGDMVALLPADGIVDVIRYPCTKQHSTAAGVQWPNAKNIQKEGRSGTAQSLAPSNCVLLFFLET